MVNRLNANSLLGKKLLTIVIVLLSSALAFGQSAKLIEARELQGEGQLKEALEVVAKLVENEGKEDGGAWFTYAEVNKALFRKETNQTKQGEYLLAALQGYQETLKFQPENTRIYLSADQNVFQLSNDLLRQGAQYFQQQKYKLALSAFENAALIRPNDTTLLTYAASSALQAKEYERAVANYRKLNALRPKVSIHQSIIGIQKDRMKNDSLALISIKEAQKAFPESYEFYKYELDLYLVSQRKDEALDLLDTLVVMYPDNHQIMLRKAVLHDEKVKQLQSQGLRDTTLLYIQYTKAEAAYRATLEQRPSNVTANFNLAMLYTDKANYYYRSINAMSMEDYQAKADDYEKKAENFIRMAVPHMEEARKAQPKSVDILRTLKSYYERLAIPNKKREIETELKALESGG